MLVDRPSHHHDLDAPLTEEELVAICRNAGERPTEQILVMSIRQVMPPYAKDHRGIDPDIPNNYGCNLQYQRYVSISSYNL